VDENRRRGKGDGEFELADTGVFNDGRYFDVTAEYAKASPDDILVRITVANRGPEAATLHLLPTLWFRNTWSWGCTHEGCEVKPRIEADASSGGAIARHATLGTFRMFAEVDANGKAAPLVFTENETNTERLFGFPKGSSHAKDAFHDYLIHGQRDVVNPGGHGTKAAWHYVLQVPPGGVSIVRLRLVADEQAIDKGFGEEFEHTFARRICGGRAPRGSSSLRRTIIQQAVLPPSGEAVARRRSGSALPARDSPTRPESRLAASF
jgi:hypothetical protein